ncbi:hypothetical protein SCHPADRAFT_911548 [Schizopora paradoxa]|uniref:Uncharacterized protein n=1 Tax=Schizopora paradoxa TaxID=27342 RepID=A0A0H2QYF8_9AGAM|nr:hypothetical protein SCHPADRAFT_911548 [Schizopora paradoxa]
MLALRRLRACRLRVPSKIRYYKPISTPTVCIESWRTRSSSPIPPRLVYLLSALFPAAVIHFPAPPGTSHFEAAIAIAILLPAYSPSPCRRGRDRGCIARGDVSRARERAHAVRKWALSKSSRMALAGGDENEFGVMGVEGAVRTGRVESGRPFERVAVVFSLRRTFTFASTPSNGREDAINAPFDPIVAFSAIPSIP